MSKNETAQTVFFAASLVAGMAGHQLTKESTKKRLVLAGILGGLFGGLGVLLERKIGQ